MHKQIINKRLGRGLGMRLVGFYPAICSIVARVGSTLIMVSLTVPPIEARSTLTGVIAY